MAGFKENGTRDGKPQKEAETCDDESFCQSAKSE